jgi:hypothetical protein
VAEAPRISPRTLPRCGPGATRSPRARASGRNEKVTAARFLEAELVQAASEVRHRPKQHWCSSLARLRLTRIREREDRFDDLGEVIRAALPGMVRDRVDESTADKLDVNGGNDRLATPRAILLRQKRD